jgi:hypothetical protein
MDAAFVRPPIIVDPGTNRKLKYRNKYAKMHNAATTSPICAVTLQAIWPEQPG